MERNVKKNGMVRVAAIAKPASKTRSAPPIAKAPTKPGNSSKLTGKCRRGARAKESRSIPESKSRDKAKGARKPKSRDVLLNHRLVAWRVVDASADDEEEEEEGRRHRHLSATEMVEKLYANCDTLHESLTMEEEDDDDANKEFNGGDEERDETDGGDEETEMDFHAVERNGKKHGMARVAAIAEPASKTPAAPAPPIARHFAKAPTKPTNHSKLTGKCRRGARAKESRSIPESKSRDKAKGARKLKSRDVLLNHRLVAWRVVDASADDDEEEEEGRRHRHLSATEMVEKLYANCNTLHESLTMEEEDDDAEKEVNGGDEERDEIDGGDEETEMDFHAVASVSWECVEGEEWLLVTDGDVISSSLN